MKVELRKKEELNGNTFYQIWVDGTCDLSFTEEKSARDKFEEMKQRAQTGQYPKIEKLGEFNL